MKPSAICLSELYRSRSKHTWQERRDGSEKNAVVMCEWGAAARSLPRPFLPRGPPQHFLSTLHRLFSITSTFMNRSPSPSCVSDGHGRQYRYVKLCFPEGFAWCRHSRLLYWLTQLEQTARVQILPPCKMNFVSSRICRMPAMFPSHFKGRN